MIRTMLHTLTVRTLDLVSEKAEASERPVVRQAGRALDRLRGVVGLDRVSVRSPLPRWDGAVPEQPMWQSDRDRLRKWQIDQGVLKPEGESTETEDVAARAPEPVVKIYFKRGCPYTRAAMDLLREREIPFREFDYTEDKALHAWVKHKTGRKTSPQLLIHDRPIGGFDELRELDESGQLRGLLEAPPSEDADTARDDKSGPVEQREGEQETTAKAVLERMEDGARPRLLDVREPQECRAGVLPGAVMIPLGELEARWQELDAKAVWVVYCRSGKRSARAQALLRARAIAGVINLRGGIEAWRAAGGPLETPTDAPRSARKLPVIGQHPEHSPFEQTALDTDALRAQLEREHDGATAGDRVAGEALVERVRAVLAECRPLIQADGGDVELLDIQDDVVSVALTGNCIGCPSAQATLRQGIERRLRQRIPQIKGIRSPQLAL